MYKIVAAAVLAVGAALPVQAATFNTLTGEAPKIIAHRGASGYLPEETLGGYELAIQMGADIVEPDVQMTADGHLIAMHDSTLTRTTNVEDLFERRNGNYRVSDFTLAEIKTLTVEPTGALASTSYPGYTPTMADPFKVPTLGEVLDFVNAHNTATGDKIGVYPESKTPAGTEQNLKIIAALHSAGFVGRDQNSYLQTFNHLAAKELVDVQGALGMDIPVATLGSVRKEGDDWGVYDSFNRSFSSLADLALFADGVGVSIGGVTAEFIAAAHALGLEVHGYTFRPTTLEQALAQFTPFFEWGIDGVFTDYTDLGVAALAEFTAPVPVPAALPLLAAGLGALGIAGRRRRRA